jgi:hypothetical protein
MKDNTKMDPIQIGREDVVRTQRAQDRDQWQATANNATNLRAPQKPENFLTSRATVSLSRRTFLHVKRQNWYSMTRK